MKATSKRRAKNDEGEVLDRATNNLLKALKQDMVRKGGRVNSEKLRKEGYSERHITKLGEVLSLAVPKSLLSRHLQ